MSLLDRLRRLFSDSEPEPDHPLSEAERKGLPQTSPEESANLLDGFVDPGRDDPR